MNDPLPFLKRVFFFKDLGPNELATIARLLKEQTFSKGSVIFREKDDADRFYILESGRVGVYKNYDSLSSRLLATHGSGHFFGEMALVDSLPRSATVIAEDDTLVLYLNRSDFQDIIQTCPGIALGVMTSISLLVRSSNEVFIEDLRQQNRELEKANIELKKAQEELQKRERLFTLGKFSSLILHDLRNPLSQAQAIVSIINEHHGKSNPDLDKDLSRMNVVLKRIERLCNEFLDYSRGDIRLNMQVTSAKLILEAVLEPFSEKFLEDKVMLNTSILYEGPVFADEDRLIRALGNCVDNARKAMRPEGGTLTIKTSVKDKYLEFLISDTGEGMTGDVLSHVFEPFFSASKSGGTGLGMLITKNIIEAHLGSISIKSEKDKGTEISIKIPLQV